MVQKTSGAFVILSWILLGTGLLGYLVGLYCTPMAINERGYYFSIMILGFFAVTSLHINLKEILKGYPDTCLNYYKLCWFITILSIAMLTVGLWNANLLKSVKGIYAFAFLIWLFVAIVVHNSTRNKLSEIKNK